MSKFQGTKINPTEFSSSQLKFYAVLVPIALFMLLPVVYIINQAFKTLPELFAFPPTIIAHEFTLDNFRRLFTMVGSTGIPFSRYLINSLIVTTAVLVLTLVLSVMTSYALSKKRFRAKGLLLKLNEMAIMFVPVAVAVPRFFIITKLGFVNNWAAHILPLIVTPIGLFLMKQFMDQVPDALLEAAQLDGANDLVIIWKIVVPLIKPAIATVSVLTFQSVWNSTETSSYFVDIESMKTLAYFLRNVAVSTNPLLAGVSAASSLFLFIPNLVIFIVMQSQVMSTMSHSGIK